MLEGDGHVGLHAGALDSAGRCVHARRHVDGHDRLPGRIDRVDRGVRRGARRALEAGAEDRVDDQLDAREGAPDAGSGDLQASRRPPRPGGCGSRVRRRAARRRATAGRRARRSRARAASAPPPARRRRCCPSRTRSPRVPPGSAPITARATSAAARSIRSSDGTLCSVDRPGVEGPHFVRGVERLEPGVGHRRVDCRMPPMILLDPRNLTRPYPDERSRRDHARDGRVLRGQGEGAAQARRPRARLVPGLPRLPGPRADLRDAADAGRRTAPTTAAGTPGGCASSPRSSASTGSATGTRGRSRSSGSGPIWMSANEGARAARGAAARGGRDLRLRPVRAGARRRHLLDRHDPELRTATARCARTARSTTSATATARAWSRRSASSTATAASTSSSPPTRSTRATS